MNALTRKLAELGVTGADPGPDPVTFGTSMRSTPPDCEAQSKHTYPPEACPEKQVTRQDTLDLLRKGGSRFWYGGHLTCDWAELCGDAPDSTCGFLLARRALTPTAKFIGINRDPAIIRRNRDAFASAADRTRWLCGEAGHLLLDLDDPDLKNVGVLVFDTLNSLGNLRLKDILTPLMAFAESQHRRLGQFLLVINLILRGAPGTSLEDGFHEYERLLKRHCDIDTVPERAYTVYTDTGKVARMQILRLTFGW